jgi:hypothetical protein
MVRNMNIQAEPVDVLQFGEHVFSMCILYNFVCLWSYYQFTAETLATVDRANQQYRYHTARMFTVLFPCISLNVNCLEKCPK